MPELARNMPGRLTPKLTCKIIYTQWPLKSPGRSCWKSKITYFGPMNTKLNSFRYSDTKWPKARSTLPQIKACCLTSPSQYNNQYWLLINDILWHFSRAMSQRVLLILLYTSNLIIIISKLLLHRQGHWVKKDFVWYIIMSPVLKTLFDCSSLFHQLASN